MKTCAECHKEFPATLDFFYKKRNSLASYCKVCHKEKGKIWKKDNHEKITAKNKEWIAKNPDKVKEINARWRNSNPDKIKEDWKNRSPESLKRKKETNKAWTLVNNDKINQHRRKRRALKNGNGHAYYTVEQVLKLYGSNCHICDMPVDLDASRQVGKAGWRLALHLDHLIPIVRGGSDTLDNVRPAHGLCNLRKGAGER